MFSGVELSSRNNEKSEAGKAPMRFSRYGRAIQRARNLNLATFPLSDATVHLYLSHLGIAGLTSFARTVSEMDRLSDAAQ